MKFNIRHVTFRVQPFFRQKTLKDKILNVKLKGVKIKLTLKIEIERKK